jgi:hypothetical protein
MDILNKLKKINNNGLMRVQIGPNERRKYDTERQKDTRGGVRQRCSLCLSLFFGCGVD